MVTDCYVTTSECQPIQYPPFQPPLSTDLLTALALTGTNHAEDQPVHLRLPLGNEVRSKHVKENVGDYAGLLGRACPAAVYEYVEDSEGGGKVENGGWEGKKLVINSQVMPFFDLPGDGGNADGFFVPLLIRIAFIASCAISKYLLRTLPGQSQKEVEVPNTVSNAVCYFRITRTDLSFIAIT